MTLIRVGVGVRASDTLTTIHEVQSGTISDATAKTLASWYVSNPAMALFATGKPVTAIALRYAVGDVARSFKDEPDAYAREDLRNLSAMLSWITSKLVTVRGEDGSRVLGR